MKETQLPSQHQIGDIVNIRFVGFGHIRNAKIIKVHFQEGGKELYDIQLSSDKLYTKIYNISAEFVGHHK